jgi:hypothetical protein
VGEETRKRSEPREEIVYNRPSPEPTVEETEPEDEFFFRKPAPDSRRLEEARSAVKKASKPAEEDFVWNVHQFPKGESRPTEEVDFQWNIERPAPPPERGIDFDPESRFHTYNKSRDEFQQLLDREYLRTNRDPEPAPERFATPPPTYSVPVEERFDPANHVREMERERQAIQPYPREESWENDLYDEERLKFNTMELRRDLLQVGLDENAKTQIIEKIKYGEEEYSREPDEFDIKKTQFVQKARDQEFGTQPETQPETRPEEDFQEQARLLTPLHPIAPTILPTKGSNEGKGNIEESSTGPASVEQVVASREMPDVDERLAKLWDTDTAPIPVASIPSQVAEALKAEELLEEGEEEDFYQEEGKRKGGFFGKLVIAIIIVVLILEGSILGLRHFAPESEATAKVNGVILNFQEWIETTFFDR